MPADTQRPEEYRAELPETRGDRFGQSLRKVAIFGRVIAWRRFVRSTDRIDQPLFSVACRDVNAPGLHVRTRCGVTRRIENSLYDCRINLAIQIEPVGKS